MPHCSHLAACFMDRCGTHRLAEQCTVLLSLVTLKSKGHEQHLPRSAQVYVGKNDALDNAKGSVLKMIKLSPTSLSLLKRRALSMKRKHLGTTESVLSICWKGNPWFGDCAGEPSPCADVTATVWTVLEPVGTRRWPGYGSCVLRKDLLNLPLRASLKSSRKEDTPLRFANINTHKDPTWPNDPEPRRLVSGLRVKNRHKKPGALSPNLCSKGTRITSSHISGEQACCGRTELCV
ncbi:uncharacterized protein LOC129690471 [Psammomys obesus]|uniref:uncharacterized protein LOC129690471 n=1 Tax=Psammomys obesus TaxID=48139 RepID=UPI0024528D68|nr:uncharacterized protein LOC129690471 [Psammomys obesus]XP_055482151.1 uncharacterized protein LOC129690471 [Psammomys obesus]XP_055482152.1 uncharacterized protein LOC129690471 [Psammomys obesus]